MDYIEEFDKLKTKVLKYIMFKKRTEQEIRQKFKEYSGELLDDVIEELKEIRIYKWFKLYRKSSKWI